MKRHIEVQSKGSFLPAKALVEGDNKHMIMPFLIDTLRHEIDEFFSGKN